MCVRPRATTMRTAADRSIGASHAAAPTLRTLRTAALEIAMGRVARVDGPVRTRGRTNAAVSASNAAETISLIPPQRVYAYNKAGWLATRATRARSARERTSGFARAKRARASIEPAKAR